MFGLASGKGVASEYDDLTYFKGSSEEMVGIKNGNGFEAVNLVPVIVNRKAKLTPIPVKVNIPKTRSGTYSLVFEDKSRFDMTSDVISQKTVGGKLFVVFEYPGVYELMLDDSVGTVVKVVGCLGWCMLDEIWVLFNVRIEKFNLEGDVFVRNLRDMTNDPPEVARVPMYSPATQQAEEARVLGEKIKEHRKTMEEKQLKGQDEIDYEWEISKLRNRMKELQKEAVGKTKKKRDLHKIYEEDVTVQESLKKVVDGKHLEGIELEGNGSKYTYDPPTTFGDFLKFNEMIPEKKKAKQDNVGDQKGNVIEMPQVKPDSSTLGEWKAPESFSDYFKIKE